MHKKSEKIGQSKCKSGCAVPQDQWEVTRKLTPEGDNSPRGAFDPRSPAKRPCTHIKVNDTDY